MKPSIQINQIGKTYGDVMALSDINLEVETGELFGLIGPDGAGKTTLFRILTSLLKPNAGEAWVEGLHTVKDYKKIRRIIGYMPGKFSLYQDLSVAENLTFFATIFGTTIQENYHLIKEIYQQLEPFKNRRAGKLSGGMKQKLALCCALIHEPKVLFLDEPTTGVDAVSRAEFWQMLKRLRERGITIMVSTPYMDEASLCERIALIQGGKILSVDAPEAITNSYQKPLYAVRTADYYRLLNDLRDTDFAERVAPFGEFLHLTTREKMPEQEIKDFLLSRGHSDIRLQPAKPTIEDVFLDLMQTT
ncbi:MAG: ABC transporter ATP-binding protein [Bacteroidetes bacterium]|nr:ABC transporter ATP-binding protein [Bacteroidota bacterium]